MPVGRHRRHLNRLQRDARERELENTTRSSGLNPGAHEFYPQAASQLLALGFSDVWSSTEQQLINSQNQTIGLQTQTIEHLIGQLESRCSPSAPFATQDPSKPSLTTEDCTILPNQITPDSFRAITAEAVEPTEPQTPKARPQSTWVDSPGKIALSTLQLITAEAVEPTEVQTPKARPQSTWVDSPGKMALSTLQLKPFCSDDDLVGNSIYVDGFRGRYLDGGDCGACSDTRHAMSCAPSSEDSLHVFIFQGDTHGLQGWLGPGSACEANRWDVLLDALLKCHAVEGRWSSNITASVLCGCDAIHVKSGARDIMGYYDSHDDWHLRVPSPHRWIEALWEYFGIDGYGIRWVQRGCSTQNRTDALDKLFDNLADELAHAKAPAHALLLRCSGAEATYDRLKAMGKRLKLPSGSTGMNIYVFFGGAKGFDGFHDRTEDFISRLTATFEAKFGPRRVTHVNLAGNGAKFFSASVASFIRIEWANGGLRDVVAAAACMRVWQ